ncbi:iron-hydroxamate ABC transporter substrate-binding protein [Paenibacillus cisolokensis]|uniref:iron-hydroxamate ABC transporter substrate-binding protein n=1 Tax=Paenibacillus cisolokensis TaxID=1658519 RepID=UPI003D2BFA97
MNIKPSFMSIALLLLAVIVSACGNSAGPSTSQGANTPQPSANETSEMRTYESETGPVEIPAKPQRIVALAHAPNVLSLGGKLVGVDQWTMGNRLFSDKLKGVAVVSETDLESVMAQNPDLIIAGAHMKNLEELGKIAPTVVYTWGKLDYLAQQREIGKLLNKESEAQQWIDDFKQRTEAIGQEIKVKFGDNVTVTVFEAGSKDFYVLGNNWARGTEILYQAMGLAMPEKVKQDALGPGYYTLSQEVMPEYAGDFIVISRSATGKNDFMTSEVWKSIPAVKNNRVIEIDTESSSYSDPITLDHLTDIFKDGFLGKQ